MYQIENRGIQRINIVACLVLEIVLGTANQRVENLRRVLVAVTFTGLMHKFAHPIGEVIRCRS